MHDPELPELWRVDDAQAGELPGDIARARVFGVLAALAAMAILAGIAALALAIRGGA